MSSPRPGTIEIVRKGLPRRYRRERRFRFYGVASLLIALSCLVLLFADIGSKGYQAFRQTAIQLDIRYDADVLGVGQNPDAGQLQGADYDALVKAALRERFPQADSRAEKRLLAGLVSSGSGYVLAERLQNNPGLLGTHERVWLLAHGNADNYEKSRSAETAASLRGLNHQQIAWLDELRASAELRLQFNTNLLVGTDSRDSELAGIRGAVVGSFFTLIVTLVLSFPMGVAAAIYLEEFAPRNRWTDFIEVNINNLAAVPSIIFGLLGLALFIGVFGMPRSAPLVGGLVLTLMTFPTVIIASRAAIRAVPPSLRDAALALGASQVQTVLHHVLPNALPGMLTGAIIGMARALGETAPLLMIGMVAFIVDVPGGLTDSATVLPVQIYLWADSPERGFTALTSAAIMVLLVFLVLMNAIAVYLRNRFEQRW